jgi:hypothetical protein
MMSASSARIALVITVVAAGFLYVGLISSQELPAIKVQQPAPDPGEVPKGVEVMTRGPIHEAFASPMTEPKATPQIAKKPPTPIDEMPPEERPEGDVIWIGGYWAYDDDRTDYLWVSGCWRAKPSGKEWVPGYWREVGTNWQWVSGFWANAQEQKAAPVTYYPEPPEPPKIAPVGDAPEKDTIYIPGYWMWNGDRYVWRAGYWTRARAGWVYVPSHYRWTPYGYVFIGGYWDYAVSRRGVLYAPVTVDVVVVGPRYVYTPYYAVRDEMVLDSMFVRPAFGVYYFGDYYGPRYVQIGFEPCVFYSRRHYEPIIVYERWHHREDPRWFDARLTLVVERNAGRSPVPPRTLVEQRTIIQNNVKVTNVTNVIAPTKAVVAAQGNKVVALDNATRTRVKETTQANQQTASVERKKLETAPAGLGPLTKTRTAPLNVASTPPVGSSGTAKSGTDSKTIGSDKTNPTLDKGARDSSVTRDTSVTRDAASHDSKVTPKDRPKKGPDDKKKKN